MSADGHDDDAAKRRRQLRWRARRGLLENDLIMTRYLDRHGDTMSDAESAALSQLLDLPDNDLLDLILFRSEPQGEFDTPDVRGLLGALRSA
jgi:antitoxin CptB